MTKGERIILTLWLPVVLVGAWQLSAQMGWVDPLFFPAPTSILAEGVRLARAGVLARNIAATLARMGAAFAIAAVTGLACGIAMGIFPRVNRSLEPVISALYTTPKISLLPMLFLLFGIGETARLALVVTSSFIIVTMHAFDAARGVSRGFVELASNYGARGLTMVRKVYLPSAMPQIFTGLRLAFGRSLGMTMTVELVSASSGLGGMIWMAGQTLATEKLYLGVVVAASLGALSHAMLRRIETVCIPWRSRSS